MNCKAFETKISPYLDGELDAKEAEELKAHLDSCVSCRELKDKLSQMGKELNMIRFAKPHDDVLDKFESHMFTKMERMNTITMDILMSNFMINCPKKTWVEY